VAALSRVAESRLEVLVRSRGGGCRCRLQRHPYESRRYDVYLLKTGRFRMLGTGTSASGR